MVAFSAACGGGGGGDLRMLIECTFSWSHWLWFCLERIFSSDSNLVSLWLFLWSTARLCFRHLGVNHPWQYPLLFHSPISSWTPGPVISSFPNRSNIRHLLITSLNVIWTTNLSPCFYSVLHIATLFCLKPSYGSLLPLE